MRLSVQAGCGTNLLCCARAAGQQRCWPIRWPPTNQLGLTQNRYRAGVASSADVATRWLAVRRSSSPPQQPCAAKNMRWPCSWARPLPVHPAVTASCPAAHTLPAQLPAQLLQHPDIAAAQRRVQAANAQGGGGAAFSLS